VDRDVRTSAGGLRARACRGLSLGPAAARGACDRPDRRHRAASSRSAGLRLVSLVSRAGRRPATDREAERRDQRAMLAPRRRGVTRRRDRRPTQNGPPASRLDVSWAGRRFLGGSEFGRPLFPAYALFELTHAATEGTAELGKPLGSEHHDDHDGDEQKVERVLQAHLSTRIRLPGALHPLGLPIFSLARITTHQVMGARCLLAPERNDEEGPCSSDCSRSSRSRGSGTAGRRSAGVVAEQPPRWRPVRQPTQHTGWRALPRFASAVPLALRTFSTAESRSEEKASTMSREKFSFTTMRMTVMCSALAGRE